MSDSSNNINITTKDIKKAAKHTVQPYQSETDKDMGRSKEQAKYMRSTRRRNFAAKMATIDPGYNKKAASILAAGTVLGLAATAVPGVGAALGPTVGGAVIASGLAALEVSAHKRVGDHAVLDTLLADQGDEWKAWAPGAQPGQSGQGGFDDDDQDWDDDDDDEDYDDFQFDEAQLGQYLRSKTGSSASLPPASAPASASASRVPLSTGPGSSSSLVSVPTSAPAPAPAASGSFDLFGSLSQPAAPAPAPAAPQQAADFDPFAEIYSRPASTQSSSSQILFQQQPQQPIQQQQQQQQLQQNFGAFSLQPQQPVQQQQQQQQGAYFGAGAGAPAGFVLQPTPAATPFLMPTSSTLTPTPQGSSLFNNILQPSSSSGSNYSAFSAMDRQF